MAHLLDEEDAYEAELIDEFDAPEALLQHDVMAHQPLVQPPPLYVSAQSLRHQPAYLEHAPVTHAQSAGALYPSFQELSGFADARNGAHSFASSSGTLGIQLPVDPSPPLQHVEPRYSRIEPSAIQRETNESSMNVGSQSQETAPRDRHVYSNASGDIAKPSLPVSEAQPHSANPPAPSKPSSTTAPEPQTPVQAEQETLPMLSEQEFEVKQREIAQELKGYEHQLNYLAHALAGDTPHQKEERKRREYERQEREHQRLLAVENRVQHQIERAHERAHEREQRRVKVLERAHRASRSPSPEMHEQRRE